MKYPKKFTMQGLEKGHMNYDFELNAATGRYETVYNGSTLTYSQEQLEGWKYHKMVPRPHIDHCNGVGADGAPKHFTKHDFEVFQRVVTKNGSEYIVVPNQNSVECFGNLCGTSTRSSWIVLDTPDGNDGDYDAGFDVVEVFSCTTFNGEMLNPSHKGELIWKYKAPEEKKEDDPLPTRIAYLQQHIDAVKENLESLQGEYDKLKKEVCIGK